MPLTAVRRISDAGTVGLLPVQDGVGEVDGHEVGEARGPRPRPAPRRSARRPASCRCPRPRRTAAGGVCVPPRPGRSAPASSVESRMVATVPSGPPRTVRGPLVHHQQPVPGRDAPRPWPLCRRPAARPSRVRVPSGPARAGPRQSDASSEQASGLVVRQQEPAVTGDDEHAFPYGVQNGVVVFVHAGHLGRPEAVGLAFQPSGDQRRARRGQREARRAGVPRMTGSCWFTSPVTFCTVRPAETSAYDLAVGPGHGDHRLHLPAERAVDALE